MKKTPEVPMSVSDLEKEICFLTKENADLKKKNKKMNEFITKLGVSVDTFKFKNF